MTEKESNLFRLAEEHHRSGRLVEASKLCQEILRAAPDEAEVLFLLGLIAHESGQPAQTVELLRRAIAIVPGKANWHRILGLDLMALGRADEAEASFRRMIALDDSSDGYINLGNLWRQQGRIEDAIAVYRQALTRDPGNNAALCNLGTAYQAKQETTAAAECFRRVLARSPEDARAMAGLGQTLLGSGRASDALPLLERAAILTPNDAELHCDLGNALQTLDRFGDASAAYQRSLQLNPKLSRAWYSWGCAETSRKEFAVAISCFRAALELRPDWPEARHNLGKALFKLGQVEEALELFRQAGAGGHLAAPQAAIAVLIPGNPASDNEGILDVRRSFAERHLPPAVGAGNPTRRQRTNGQPLRIGYVSSFFRDHNWMKPVWGLINHHDRTRFEMHLFSDCPASDVKHGYQAHPQDQFYDTTRLTNRGFSEAVEAAKIDVLVDLNGYSTLHRLPLYTLRPAPVIVGWFNMYATTGMPCYDYLIGDEVVVPAEEERFYCEKIERVPGSYLAFEVTYPVPPVTDPPFLTKGAITFGSLASQYKITRQVIEVWSRILHQVPGSALILKNASLGSAGDQRFVHDLFLRQGIPAERVRLEGPSDHYRFLETYGDIDIALDTFPYNGGTTTTEAIWQGVLVVNFHGDRWVARTSASICRAAGLGEFVAGGLEDYASMAVHLAAEMVKDPGRFKELRRGMRARIGESPVCDMPKFARNMESLYSRMLDALN